jgi:hypothetical protein
VSPVKLALALAALVLTQGCLGNIRNTTTPRTAQEQLLLTTAAERAIGQVDSSKWVGRKVFLDVTPLPDKKDRGYVVAAFEQRVEEGGGKLVPRERADIVIEVRSAALGCYDGKWIIYVPAAMAVGVVAPDEANGIPTLVSIGYSLQEGWARIDAFAYDAKTNAYVTGWRDRWGRAYVGFFDDIYPDFGIAETVTTQVK